MRSSSVAGGSEQQPSPSRAVIDLLAARFGPLPNELSYAIERECDPETLRCWLMLALTVASLDQFRQTTGL